MKCLLSHILLESLLVALLLARPLFARSDLMAAAPAGFVESGVPSYTVHSLAALGVQSDVFDVRSLPDGRLLVVSADQLVLGDGAHWQVIGRSEGEQRRFSGQLCMTPDGALYCEQGDGFYRVEFDGKGRWRLGPCLASAGDRESLPALYFNRWIGDECFWYGTGLYSWTPGSGKAPRRIYEGKVDLVFRIGPRLYFSDPNRSQLFSVSGMGEPEPVMPRGWLHPSGLIASVALETGDMLVSNPSRGVGVFNGVDFGPIGGSSLLAGRTQVNELVAVGNGLFAALVSEHGMVLFDRQGRVLQAIDSRADPHFAGLRCLHQARDGSLWAIGGDSLVHVAMPSRLSFVSSLLVDAASNTSLVRHEGRLWLMTGRKVLRGVYDEENRFQSFVSDSPPSGQVCSLSSIEGHLVAGTQTGLYERTAGGWVCVDPALVDCRIVRKSEGTGLWYYTGADQWGWVDARGAVLRVQRHVLPGMQRSYQDLASPDGTCWMELGVGRLARADLRSLEAPPRIYSKAEGLPLGWPELYVIDGALRVHCAHRCLIYNSARDQFEPDEDLLRDYPMLTEVSGRPALDSAGRIWARSPTGVQIVSNPHSAKPTLEHLAVNLHPLSYIAEANGVVWTLDFKQLMRYDPAMPEPAAAPLPPVITEMDLPGSGRRWLDFQREVPRLQPEDTVAILRFMLPGLRIGQSAGLEVKVEGLGTDWVGIGSEGTTVLNRLRAGSYTLHVRAMDAGRAGQEAVLAFVVEPPWFRTPLAYVLWVLLALVVLGVVVALELLKRHQLAVTVDRRTAELRASEERLRGLNLALEERISERDRLEEQIVQLRKMESIGQLAGGIAHDFNNMLTPILSYAMVMRDELPPSDVRRADLEEIVQSAFRARDLTRQLLAFARQQKLVLQNLQLNEVVSRMERMLRRTLRENVLIELRLTEPLPQIQGDLGQLEQVVLNLAINAQDAMPDGGRLVIGTREALHPNQRGGVPAGHFVCLIVTDTGHGMDEKTKGRIFDPFFTTKALGRGTGLGLSTVYGIVRQHQAFIEVESEQGKGTTFTLYFPAHAVEGAPDKPETGTETQPARCQGLVLLVEDQPRVRVSTRRVLERQGYRVIDVGTGAEALELAARQTEPIDLLVTDVIMDGLNGVQVQQALVGIFPKLRTLYMSGYPADVIGRHGVLEKGIHFLPKPFTPEELIRACQRACA